MIRTAAAISVVFLAVACAIPKSAPEIALEKARTSLEAGRHEEVLRATERAEGRRFVPKEVAAEAAFLRARALLGMGEKTQAEANFRVVVDHYSSSPLVERARAELAKLKVVDAAPATVSGGSLADWGFLEEVVLQYANVRYPEIAVKQGIEGRVLVAFQVAEDGQPSQIRVLSSPHPVLTGAAIDAIAHSRIDPAMLGLTDKSSFPVTRKTQVNFQLD